MIFRNKYSFLIIFFLLLTILLLTTTSYGADPKLVSKIKNAFEKISDWMLKISTPAAAVAVGTGILMKKFSFGDEERIRTRQTFNSWFFILVCLYASNRFNLGSH